MNGGGAFYPVLAFSINLKEPFPLRCGLSSNQYISPGLVPPGYHRVITFISCFFLHSDTIIRVLSTPRSSLYPVDKPVLPSLCILLHFGCLL